MQNYIVAHYGEVEPQFIYTETLEASRLCVLALVADSRTQSTDIIAITDAVTNEILFYGNGKKILAQLSRSRQSGQSNRSAKFFSIRPFIHWMSTKLTNLATW